MIKTKSITLASGNESGWYWTLTLRTAKNLFSMGFTFEHYLARDKSHARIRCRDKNWIYYNIPSSIWWFNEMHHDWKNGGRMYLLTKAEHILRHRSEKAEK